MLLTELLEAKIIDFPDIGQRIERKGSTHVSVFMDLEHDRPRFVDKYARQNGGIPVKGGYTDKEQKHIMLVFKFRNKDKADQFRNEIVKGGITAMSSTPGEFGDEEGNVRIAKDRGEVRQFRPRGI